MTRATLTLVTVAVLAAVAPSARVVLGRTEPMLRVNDDPEAELQLGAARTGSRGVASVDLPAGTTACALIVTAPEHLGAFEPRVVLDGDVTRHELDLTGETLDVVEILAASTGEPTDVELTATLVESARYGLDSALDVRRIDVGRFELTGRGDDDVELTLSAPGSADQHATIAGASRSHTVEWEPTPPAVVRGRVVGDDGDVLPGARVYLSPTGPASTRAGRREVEADDRGRFELSSRPGPHTLSAIADRHHVTRLELDLAAGDLDLGDVVLASVGRLVIVDRASTERHSIEIARDVGADDDEEWKPFYILVLTVQGHGVVERAPAVRYRIERPGYPTRTVDVVAGETTTSHTAPRSPCASSSPSSRGPTRRSRSRRAFPRRSSGPVGGSSRPRRSPTGSTSRCPTTPWRKSFRA